MGKVVFVGRIGGPRLTEAGQIGRPVTVEVACSLPRLTTANDAGHTTGTAERLGSCFAVGREVDVDCRLVQSDATGRNVTLFQISGEHNSWKLPHPPGTGSSVVPFSWSTAAREPGERPVTERSAWRRAVDTVTLHHGERR